MNNSKFLISALLIPSSLGIFSIPAISQTKLIEKYPKVKSTVSQTTVVNFICNRESTPGGTETLLMEMERRHTPLVRSTSARFDAPCQKVATRFQQFYNCGILDNLSTGFEITTAGDRYPAIFAQIKPAEGDQSATLDLCPALKPFVKDGKLLLLKLERGVNAEQMRELLDDLRVGVSDAPL